MGAGWGVGVLVQFCANPAPCILTSLCFLFLIFLPSAKHFLALLYSFGLFCWVSFELVVFVVVFLVLLVFFFLLCWFFVFLFCFCFCLVGWLPCPWEGYRQERPGAVGGVLESVRQAFDIKFET